MIQVNKKKESIFLVYNFVLYHTFIQSGQQWFLSYGHDREKGGECCRSEYKCCGNEYIPVSYGIFTFGRKIPSLLYFS